MPIYEYRCDACGHAFDALQKISDPLLTDCPDCGEVRLRKLVSAPSFRLKGGGWYETDFKSDKDKRRNLAGDAAESKKKPADGAAANKDAKSDPKPKSGADKKGADGGKAA